MAHPDAHLVSVGKHRIEQQTVLLGLDLRVTKLPEVRCNHFAAKLSRHRLKAIANAENGHTQRKDTLGYARGGAFGDGFWAAG